MTENHDHGDVVRPKAMRKRIFGYMLLGLGIITTVSARVFGFELDAFYVVISIAGASLILYGTFQKHGAG